MLLLCYYDTIIEHFLAACQAACRCTQFRADDLYETEVFLRERYEIGIRYTKLSQLAYQTQPSKDGGEGAKVGERG